MVQRKKAEERDETQSEEQNAGQPAQGAAEAEAQVSESETDSFKDLKTAELVNELDEIDAKMDQLRTRRALLGRVITARLKRKR